MRSRFAEGFTLLEAIVALTILSAAGLALFAGMTQSLQMVQRADRARASDAALRNAIAWLAQVNPMLSPEGAQPLGDYRLVWRARPVEAPRDGTTGYLQPGLYKVGLYDLDIELWRGRSLEREATLRRAGWEQVREPPEL